MTPRIARSARFVRVSLVPSGPTADPVKEVIMLRRTQASAAGAYRSANHARPSGVAASTRSPVDGSTSVTHTPPSSHALRAANGTAPGG